MQKAIEEQHTEKAVFSKVSKLFGKAMLTSLGITKSHLVDARQSDRDAEMLPFCWYDGLKEDEDIRTPEACLFLATLLNLEELDGNRVVVEDVHRCSLYKLLGQKEDGTHLEASGQTDLAISIWSPHRFADNCLSFTCAIVELKTTAAPLTEIQLSFELLSASQMSTYGRGVAILGTDLNKKWTTGHFSYLNTIDFRSYASKTIAVEEFKTLIKSCPARQEELQPRRRRLSVVPEDGTDGEGEEPGGGRGTDSRNLERRSDDLEPGGGPSQHSSKTSMTGGNPSGPFNVSDALEQDLAGCFSENEVMMFERQTWLAQYAAVQTKLSGWTKSGLPSTVVLANATNRI